METYKININDKTKENIKKMQNLSLTIDNSAYAESVKQMGAMLNNFAKAMIDVLPDTKLINESLRYSIGSIAKTMSSYNYTATFEGMSQMAKELAATLSKMQIE